jgi:excisionase family DNA binding protein
MTGGDATRAGAEILTPAEAAALLGCSVRTVYGLCRRPDFPVVRLNARCYRIPAWRLRQWLDAQTSPTAPRAVPWPRDAGRGFPERR